MAAQQPEPLTLRQRYKALPQELQDQIHDCFFQFKRPSYMTITTIILKRDTKPPMELHINRAIREIFVKAYYTKTIFQSEDATLLRKFLNIVPRRYLRSIYHIRLDGGVAWDEHEARAQATAFMVSVPEDIRGMMSYDQFRASYQLSPMAWVGPCWVAANPPDGLRGGEQAPFGFCFRRS